MKVTESELVERVNDVLRDVPKTDFISIVNQVLGTGYKQKDIEWDG